MAKTPNENDDIEITVTLEDREEYKRLDVYLTAKFSQFSRSTIKRLFDSEDISSDTISLSLNKMPPAGTVIEIEVPPPIPSDLQGELQVQQVC